MKSNAAKIYVGTSGWSYNHWAGAFYPNNSKKDWLKFYSDYFKTVEINSSFYHQIDAKTYKKWYNGVGGDFVFSIKISRYISHIKRLNQAGESWRKFVTSLKELKGKTGPVLLQLPPNFCANPEKLENFLKLAKGKYKIAFEARNESWFSDKTYKILKKYKSALVWAHQGKWLTPEIVTSDFLYIRLHGSGNIHSSLYGEKFLRKLAAKIKKLKNKVKKIYIYFNNDQSGYAVKNAKSLIKIIQN